MPGILPSRPRCARRIDRDRVRLLAPVLCLFLIGLIETGAIYYLNSTLTNAANDTARMVRTGQVQATSMTKVQYIAQICTQMTV